jgi:hypothetical protein
MKQNLLLGFFHQLCLLNAIDIVIGAQDTHFWLIVFLKF